MARSDRFSAARVTPLLGAGLLVALVAAPALAGEVYKWKDAKGVTHYSDAPPAGSNYESREIRHRPGMPAASAGAEGKPAENSQCSIARANLETLAGDGPVGVDADGDGKPDSNMDAGQRADQRALAEASIRANCGETAAS